MYSIRDGKCVSVAAIMNYSMCVFGVEEIQNEGRKVGRKEGRKEGTKLENKVIG